MCSQPTKGYVGMVSTVSTLACQARGTSSNLATYFQLDFLKKICYNIYIRNEKETKTATANHFNYFAKVMIMTVLYFGDWRNR